MLRSSFLIFIFAFISTFAFWSSHVNTYDAQKKGNKTTYSLSSLAQDIFKQIGSKSNPQASADVAKLLTDNLKSSERDQKFFQKQLDLAKKTLSANQAAQGDPAKDLMELRYQSNKILRDLPSLAVQAEDSSYFLETQNTFLKSLQNSPTPLPLSVEVDDAIRSTDQGSNWAARGIWFGSPINSGLKLEYKENPLALDAIFLMDKDSDNERLLCDQEGNVKSFTKTSVQSQAGSADVLTPQELSKYAKEGSRAFVPKPPCPNTGRGIESDLQGVYKSEKNGRVTYTKYSPEGAKEVASFDSPSKFTDETVANSITWTCIGPSGILYIVTQYPKGYGNGIYGKGTYGADVSTGDYTFDAIKKTDSGIIYLNDVDPTNPDSVYRYKQMQSLDPKAPLGSWDTPLERGMQKTQDQLPKAEPPLGYPTAPMSMPSTSSPFGYPTSYELNLDNKSPSDKGN